MLVDNERGGYLALRHLYELGHRKVNFLLGPKQLSDSSRRWAGMRRFGVQSGMDMGSSRVLQLPNLSDPLTGFAQERSSRAGGSRKRPTAPRLRRSTT